MKVEVSECHLIPDKTGRVLERQMYLLHTLDQPV